MRNRLLVNFVRLRNQNQICKRKEKTGVVVQSLQSSPKVDTKKAALGKHPHISYRSS